MRRKIRICNPGIIEHFRERQNSVKVSINHNNSCMGHQLKKERKRDRERETERERERVQEKGIHRHENVTETEAPTITS